MDREKAGIAVIITSILTILSIYKRQQHLGGLKEFELEFGRSFLRPHFFLFSLLSAFVLTSALNYRVGRESYRHATNYYEDMKDKKAFLKALSSAPLETLASSDAERVSKHLNLPEWLSVSITAFIAKYLQLSYAFPYISVGVGLTFLTLIIYIVWKT